MGNGPCLLMVRSHWKPLASVILAKVKQRKSDQRNSGRVLFIKETHCACMLQDAGSKGGEECSCKQGQTSGFYFTKEGIQK